MQYITPEFYQWPESTLSQLLVDSMVGNVMTKILICKWTSTISHQEKLCKLVGTVFILLLGIPVFVRRLTQEEVKDENEASSSSLLDAGKEVIYII